MYTAYIYVGSIFVFVYIAHKLVVFRKANVKISLVHT